MHLHFHYAYLIYQNTCIYTPCTLSALIPTQGKQYKHLDNSDMDTISFAVGLEMSEVNNVSLT